MNEEDSSYKITSSDETFEVNVMSMYSPELRVAIFHTVGGKGQVQYVAYDFEKETVTDVGWFQKFLTVEVPDEFLLDKLPEDYTTESAANWI